MSNAEHNLTTSSRRRLASPDQYIGDGDYGVWATTDCGDDVHHLPDSVGDEGFGDGDCYWWADLYACSGCALYRLSKTVRLLVD